jgi:hypothetical protein
VVNADGVETCGMTGDDEISFGKTSDGDDGNACEKSDDDETSLKSDDDETSLKSDDDETSLKSDDA